MKHSSADQREIAADYFEMLAGLGMTKHLGSLDATHSIVAGTHIDASTLVLDAGCGTGLTPAYLARRYRTRVIGVDLTFGMLQQAKREARSRGVARRVTFCAADVQALPFAAGTFDTVIVESVSVFVPDRALAFSEYVRVTRPGGYVGITESTWMAPPDAEAHAFMKSVGGVALMAEDWVRLMEEAGLQDVTAETARVDVRAEARGRMKRMGCLTLARSASNLIPVLLRSRRSRRTLGRALGSTPRQVARMMGYGVYIGRKPAR